MADPKQEELTQFQDLAKEIRDLGLDTPQYKVFVASISAAEQKMAALHQTKRNKLAPVLSAQDRIDLLNLHRKIGQAAELLLGAQPRPDEALRKKARKLTAITANNYRTIKAYDPAKEEKSLPELLEDARAVTLNLQDAELEDTMSGNLSKRQPISYLNDKGKKVTGVFTPKKTADFFGGLQKIFEEEANDPQNHMTEEAKQMMRGFLALAVENQQQISQKNRGQSFPNVPQKVKNLTSLLWGLSFGKTLYPDYLEQAFCHVYPQLEGQNLSRVFGKGTMERLCRKMEPLSTFIGIHVDSANIGEGARLDNRNAAMCSAADLLGVSHLVAKSAPMKLIGPNGEVTEGTFMKKGKGLDPDNLTNSALGISENALNGTDGKGFKDLADLQVLDFLCGNVDRHGGNLFYQFQNGKFCGVQAIDNDCAFGSLRPTGVSNINRLVVPKNMKAISRSMYNRILTLTPEELKFALRGYGLSESELEASAYRLDKLQTELKKGTIRIMEDQDFKNLNARTVKDLCVANAQTGDPQNLFETATRTIKKLHTYRMTQGKAYRDLEEMDAIGEANRALPGSQDRESEQCDRLLGALERVTNRGMWHFHKGTSPEFEAIRTAVQQYKECQLRVRDKIRDANSEGRKTDPDAPLDAVVSDTDLEKMAKLSQTIREKADAYLEKKAGSRFNSYTNSRKAVARIARSFGEYRETVREEERQTQEKQLQAAETKSKRMLEKQKQNQNQMLL